MNKILFCKVIVKLNKLMTNQKHLIKPAENGSLKSALANQNESEIRTNLFYITDSNLFLA